MRNQGLLKALSVFSLFLMIACQSDDAVVVYEQGTNEYVNQWMYDNMKQYSYWNESIPKKTDLSLDPSDYFRKLLSAEDRFSYAMHPSLPETAPQSLRKSFGFDISFVEYNGEVFGAVLYVLTDSPAQRKGLKRGQFITSIHGLTLNMGNYEALYEELINTDTAQLQVVNYAEGSGFSTPHSVTISRSFTFSQPIDSHVIEQGSHKVGYIYIPHFDIGQAGLFAGVFEQFKNNGVTDVIVDLRYNGGGDISSAAALSILLAPAITADDLFIRFKGNRNGGEINQSFKEALDMNESNLSFESLRNSRPSISKVYVLCGNHTASASEIIINNLKPYLEVITIGQKTVGKDVAGFPIEDDRIAGQRGWVLNPSIYKLSNANGEGNYNQGINAAFTVDELQDIALYPLGDGREVLLKAALDLISGNGDRTTAKQLQPLHKLRDYIHTESLTVNF